MILLFKMRKRRDIFKIAVKLGGFMDLVVAFRKCHLSFCLLALPYSEQNRYQVVKNSLFKSFLPHTTLSSEVTFLATPYINMV